jgi:hypothetical protein
MQLTQETLRDDAEVDEPDGINEQDDTSDDGDKDTAGGNANSGKKIAGNDSDNANEKSRGQDDVSGCSSGSEE